MLVKCCFLIFILTSAFGTRILGIAPIPSYSHQLVFNSLWKELSLRGHQVTVLTTNPVKDSSLTNITEIDTSFVYDIFENENETNLANTNILTLMLKSLNGAADLLERQLQNPKVQSLIQNETEHFDLVIVEAIFPAMYAFSERFNCPFIGITSADSRARNYRILGNPNHPILYVDFLKTHTSVKNFWNRLERAFYTISGNLVWEVLTTYKQQKLVDKYFGTNYPILSEIEGKMSMMFTNTDPIFHPIRALLPNIIQIGGGTHLGTATKPLPKDLQKQLDDAKTGFIYFSLGSNVKSKALSLETRQILLETFSELPYLVLWKFELEDLPGKPNNVIISKWFPQKDIFRHSNIKLFVSQGGLQSMEEALYSNVPIVGLPFYGDQPRNMEMITRNGMGLTVDVKSLNKENFKATILEVHNNPQYKENVRKMVELARDQPMTGLEKAVWWTEYVLRHKGAIHFRSPALDVPAYQYYLLDIIGICLFIISIVIFVVSKCVKFTGKVFRRIHAPKLKVS